MKNNTLVLILLAAITATSAFLPCMGQDTAKEKILNLIKKTPDTAITVYNILKAAYETKTTLDNFTAVASNISSDINDELSDLKNHVIKTIGENNTQIKLLMTLDTIPKLIAIVKELNDMGKHSAKLMKLLGENLIHYIHEESGTQAVTTASRIDLIIADLNVAMNQIINELIDPLKREITRSSILQGTNKQTMPDAQQLLEVLESPEAPGIIPPAPTSNSYGNQPEYR